MEDIEISHRPLQVQMPECHANIKPFEWSWRDAILALLDDMVPIIIASLLFAISFTCFAYAFRGIMK